MMRRDSRIVFKHRAAFVTTYNFSIPHRTNVIIYSLFILRFSAFTIRANGFMFQTFDV